MNRLLKVQLKKVYGKDFDIETQDDNFKKFLLLVEQGYEDLYIERQLLENTLEVNSEELTQSNKIIKKNHELVRSVTNSVSDVIFYKDLNFRYIGCNKNFELLAGKSEEEIIGKEDYELFDKKFADMFRSMDSKILTTNKEQRNSEWVKFPDGRESYFSTFKAPLLDSSGTKIGIVGVSRDITKETELEKELQDKHTLLIQQNRFASMGEMIGNIAHQWRQPLNALGLIIQKIEFYYQRDILDSQKLRQSVQKSLSLIDGMSETIDDFRDFFNPHRVKSEFSLQEAIKQAYSIVEPAFENQNIHYSFQSDEDFIINGFKNEFSQVILNLLNNAKDALVENQIKTPTIFINIIKENEKIVINICDNAGGINQATLEKIFDPYFTTKDEGKGTGLGLYMSKMIIEDHMSGELTAKNSIDGMIFQIIL